MTRHIVVGLTLALGLGVASAQDAIRIVDLRGQRALEQLKASNPAHFESIQRIVAALSERPEQVTESWLRTTFNAKDFSLQRGVIMTSDPPKQFLQFTLEDVRYKMHIVWSSGARPHWIRP